MWVHVARMSRKWRGLYDTRSQVHNEVLRDDALLLTFYGALAGERWQEVEKVKLLERSEISM